MNTGKPRGGTGIDDVHANSTSKEIFDPLALKSKRTYSDCSVGPVVLLILVADSSFGVVDGSVPRICSCTSARNSSRRAAQSAASLT